ncbi:C40 family peptidase [Alkalicoccus luteus]|uniref:C40 family peptidase n=1 Tax=Alkalicoccus luteus TaxID=1237094 RepID=UPI0040343020
MTYRVIVPVATVWTSPDKPRDVDEQALEEPLNVRGWLKGLSTKEAREELTKDNIIQTQVLYNDKVEVEEVQGEWAKVYVPHQPSRKAEQGYPGWIPLRQLQQTDDVSDRDTAVSTATAWLYKDGEAFMEVSWQTRFHQTGSSDSAILVDTPHGELELPVKAAGPAEATGNGEEIVRSGLPFLELPYLWGGMSGFGFDCSGLVYTVLRAWGIDVSRDASDQEKEGEAVAFRDKQPGDLLFFAKDGGTGNVYHVGFYYGGNQMLHAPSAGNGIELVDLERARHMKDYCSTKRVIT